MIGCGLLWRSRLQLFINKLMIDDVRVCIFFFRNALHTSSFILQWERIKSDPCHSLGAIKVAPYLSIHVTRLYLQKITQFGDVFLVQDKKKDKKVEGSKLPFFAICNKEFGNLKLNIDFLLVYHQLRPKLECIQKMSK